MPPGSCLHAMLSAWLQRMAGCAVPPSGGPPRASRAGKAFQRFGTRRRLRRRLLSSASRFRPRSCYRTTRLGAPLESLSRARSAWGPGPMAPHRPTAPPWGAGAGRIPFGAVPAVVRRLPPARLLRRWGGEQAGRRQDGGDKAAPFASARIRKWSAARPSCGPANPTPRVAGRKPTSSGALCAPAAPLRRLRGKCCALGRRYALLLSSRLRRSCSAAAAASRERAARLSSGLSALLQRPGGLAECAPRKR